MESKMEISLEDNLKELLGLLRNGAPEGSTKELDNLSLEELHEIESRLEKTMSSIELVEDDFMKEFFTALINPVAKELLGCTNKQEQEQDDFFSLNANYKRDKLIQAKESLRMTKEIYETMIEEKSIMEKINNM